MNHLTDRITQPLLHHIAVTPRREGNKDMFYLTSHSTHCIYCYMIVVQRRTYGKGPFSGEESCCCHYMGYSVRLAARVLLYTPSYRQDNTCNAWYTSHETLVRTRNSSMGPPQGTHRARADALPRSYHSTKCMVDGK